MQRDYVLHSRQKAAQLENTSEGGWVMGRALRKELRFQAERGSTWAAGCAQPVSLGRAHVHIGFVSLLLPSSLGPLTCICFYPYFSACVIWVNGYEAWILNFVGNTDLLLWCCKTPSTALLSFQKSKENDEVCFEAYVWDSIESHLYCRGLLSAVGSISVI